MRVEMILHGLPRAGMEVITAALARGLRGRGHDVGFTCLQFTGSVGDELASEGFRVSVVPEPGVWTNVRPRGLTRWLSELQPDIVHAHSGAWLKAVQAARMARIGRVVATIHGLETDEPWYQRIYERLAASRTDVVIAVSASLRNHLVDMIGIPAGKVVVVRNGMPQGLAAGPGSALMPASVPADRLVIGTVARFTPVKNHSLLIDAFREVRGTVPSAFLLLVGDGPCRPAVEDRIRQLGLEADVLITGEVPAAHPFYASMDVFALPSLHEGTSVSLLEALSCGVPAVATDVGGNREVLDCGRAGILVPSADAGALAAALVRLLSSGELRHTLAAAGTRHVAGNYSADAMVSEYERIYAATCSSAGHEQGRSGSCVE